MYTWHVSLAVVRLLVCARSLLACRDGRVEDSQRPCAGLQEHLVCTPYLFFLSTTPTTPENVSVRTPYTGTT